MRPRSLVLFPLMLGAAGSVAAQALPLLPRFTVDGTDGILTASIGGNACANAGDTNGDGVDDFIVADPFDRPNWFGRVHVISGADGSELWRVTGTQAFGRLGTEVAGDVDLNADGRTDVLALEGSGSLARAFAYDGSSGALLWFLPAPPPSLQFASLSGIEDVNGDGKDDVIIGSFSGSGIGAEVRIHSGADGSTIRILPSPQVPSAGQDHFGFSVADVGDFDGDGLDDVVVGQPTWHDANGVLIGAVHVFSSGSGQKLKTYPSPYTQSYAFGYQVDGLGDQDGDGHPDVVGSLFSQSVVGFAVVSGTTGQILANRGGTGRVLRRAGDVDGDGIEDIVSGFWTGSARSTTAVRVTAGGTFETLYQWTSFLDSSGSGTVLGSCVCGGGDINGDGLAEFAFGTRNSPGRFEIHYGQPPIREVGDGCMPDPSDFLRVSGTPHISQVLRFELFSPGGTIGAAVLVGLPLEPPVPLDPLMPGCVLYVDAITSFAGPFNVSRDWRVPNNPTLVGATLRAQGVSLVPGANPLGALLSNAIEAYLGVW